LNRQSMLDQLAPGGTGWDIIIIGGGATGLGTAIDAAHRGFRTLLLEQADFAQGTSSRSTKLVHGGVRYLQQGNVALVLEALKERGRLRDNAPHLVHDLPFVVPNYDWWEAPFYGIGLRLYDMLAGKHGFGKSRNLSREKTLERIPTIETEGLRGGVVYYDGQFDDARLAINMAQTAADHGACLINYMRVGGLVIENDCVTGVRAIDCETEDEYEIHARVVINATGVFTDSVRRMESNDVAPMIRPSQGVHIVLDQSFLPGDSAIMVPHTDDGRVLFAIPWHGRTVVGTTDTPVDDIKLDPKPFDDELGFLIEHAARYLEKDPTASDVLSAFAGLRPLVSMGGGDGSTAAISRDHTIHISGGGLMTIAGGKWTTYRKMAEDAVDQAIALGGLDERRCETHHLPIHGALEDVESLGDLAVYGSDAAALKDVIAEQSDWTEPLHKALPVMKGQIVWAARHEMARTVEDCLSRRTRCLLLDARASVDAAPAAAVLLAAELGQSDAWARGQVKAYTERAQDYMMG
jgi:glycerol-3-phosphate dehydrogenase